MVLYTAMTEIIRPLWSFLKIYLDIRWSLFTENKHNMLLLYIICQHNAQYVMKETYNRTILCLFSVQSDQWMLRWFSQNFIVV